MLMFLKREEIMVKGGEWEVYLIDVIEFRFNRNDHCNFFYIRKQKNKRMSNDPIEDLCLQPDVFYVCKCLFDEVEKIKFYQVTCHEDILLLLTSLTNQSRHLYSASLAFLREGAILCTSYIWVFMIVTDGKRICSHFKAELKIDEKI